MEDTKLYKCKFEGKEGYSESETDSYLVDRLEHRMDGIGIAIAGGISPHIAIDNMMHLMNHLGIKDVNYSVGPGYEITKTERDFSMNNILAGIVVDDFFIRDEISPKDHTKEDGWYQMHNKVKKNKRNIK